jgi:SAM-dependent methyltransferase
MGGPVRLDLGAGHKKYEGWISVDFDVTRKKYTEDGGVQDIGGAINPHVAADLKALPFPDNYADEARAIHVIEHFYLWDVPAVLKEWVRVLKPGAEIAVECPCLNKILKLFEVPNVPPHLTYWGLFGDPRLKDPLMMHHWCFEEKHLVKFMTEAGLEDVHGEVPQFHAPLRDMRLVGTKPAEAPRIVLADAA